MIEVTLPWPAPALSPNYSGKLRRRISAKMQYREDAYWLTKEALMNCHTSTTASGATTIPVSLTFCPPNKRERDLDNFQASVKHGLDGIAFALGVNDALFRPVSDWGEPRKGGAVIVRLGTL